MLIRRSILAVTVLAGTALLAAAPADAAPQPGVGQNVTPAQPFLLNPNASDWLGSYVVAGQPVWAADFALAPPDSAATLTPTGTPATKWGTPLATDVAAKLSYLLWRYGSTTSVDDAAALQHIVYDTTSAPQNPAQLSPANDARHIAYDAPYHRSKLPVPTQAAITTLNDDAAANAGTWTIDGAAVKMPLTIGSSVDWQLTVNTGGHGVPNVPVTLTTTDAALPNGTTTQTVTTSATGDATVPLKITGASPAVVAHVDAPATAPEALTTGTQNGSPVLRAATTAVTARAAWSAAPAPSTTGPSAPGSTTRPSSSGAANPPASGHGGATTPLPNTGSDVVLPIVIGLVAIGLGAVLLVVSRRTQRRR